MAEWIADASPELGFSFTEKKVRIINREVGLRTLGSVMQFDLKRRSAETKNNKEGDRNSCWVNVVDCNFEVNGNKGGHAYMPYVVLIEDVGPGLEGMAVLWSGEVLIKVNANGCALGDGLGINADLSNECEASDGVTPINGGAKLFARTKAPRAGAGLVRCYFNGWHYWAKP